MRGLLLVTILSACGNKATPPVQPAPPPDAAIDAAIVDAPLAANGPLDRDLPRLALRSVALYEAVVATFRTAGADCGAATKRLGELRVEYADVTAANAKVLHEGRARELKAALVPHDDKLDAAAREIVGAQTMSKCTSDRAFTKSFDDLVGAPP
jgi:hypothetical protein